MKQFKTVLKFEYLNYIKSRTFIGITIFFIIAILIFSFFPQIQDGIGSIFGSDDTKELPIAAIYDESGIYSTDVLNKYVEEYNWKKIDSLDNVENLIEDETYDFVLHIDGLDIDIYQSGSSILSSDASSIIPQVVQTVYQQSYLSNAGLTDTEIDEVLGAEPNVNTISVGKDITQNIAISYVVLFVLYFALIFYGASIGTSVVTEKSSKAMELLVTSAKPMPLMFGKVFGVGLAGLTQLGLIFLTILAGLSINMDSWNEAYPLIGAILESSFSASVLIYAIVFFLLGFFSFAFVYAGLCSTISRVEDANSVTVLPQFLVIIAFMLAMFGLTSPEASHLTILSFVPFFSPMIMFMRICLLDLPVWEILLSIGLNIVYIFLLGFICSRIYRVGVMLYGNKPKLKDILSYIRS